MENSLDDYTVTSFSSISVGPLNKRQEKIRDHFMRAMEFLGLADVDIDALAKTQRDEILALAAQRRKELGSPNSVYDRADQSNVNERGASLNKRQWDLKRGLNIKLYKALDALGLIIHDVEVLTQEQRGIIYAELKRQEKTKKSTGQQIVHSDSSAEYEKLEKLYTSKPETFVDVSSLRKLVTQPQAKTPRKPTTRQPRNHEAVVSPAEIKTVPDLKPKPKDKRKPTALCPQPYKRTYATNELAQTFIDKAHPNDKNIAPYLCPCGAIHIGHKNRSPAGTSN